LKRLITLLTIAGLMACTEQPSNHPIFKYYPPNSILEDGYVSKYYSHWYPDNPDQNAATGIIYIKVKKVDETHFITEEYNAGFQLMDRTTFEVNGDTLKMVDGMNVGFWDPTDTTTLRTVNHVVSVWDGQMSAPFQLLEEYNETEYRYSEMQQQVYDSTILDKPAKVFRTTWTYQNVVTDSVVNEGNVKAMYVQGLGYYGKENKMTAYARQLELIELMSVQAFEQLADHDEHRIGWIDARNTLSDDSDFELCNHEIRIADYYNSTPDGRYIHNKRAMLDTIYSNLDKSKLIDQTGSLVFRFVVNCKGEAGRFIARGYDVNYQPMTFREETVQHLFSILQRLEEWRPVVIREEARDAYFYINIKIDNGEIIDILP